MGHGAATATVLAALLVAGCSSTPDPRPSDSVSATDPLSQTTRLWSVDRPSEDWFSTLCGVLTDLEPAFTGPDDQVVADLTATGDTLITTSSRLGGMPVPTFEGGSEYATDTVSDLAELGRVYQEAAELWDDGQPDLARDTVNGALTDRSPDLDSLDPVISEQLRNLPACQSVRSTF